MAWNPQYDFDSTHSLTWSGNPDVPAGGANDIEVQAAEFSHPKLYRFNSTFPKLKLALQYAGGSYTGFNWHIFDELGKQALEGPGGSGVYDFNIYTAAGYNSVNSGIYGTYSVSPFNSPLWTEPSGLKRIKTGNHLVGSVPWVPGGVDDYINIYGTFKTGVYEFANSQTYTFDDQVVGTGIYGYKASDIYPWETFTSDGGQQYFTGEIIYSGSNAISTGRAANYEDWITRDTHRVMPAGGWRRFNTRQATEGIAPYEGFGWNAHPANGVAVIGQPSSLPIANMSTSGASVIEWRDSSNSASGRYMEYSWKEGEDTRGKTYTFSLWAYYISSDDLNFDPSLDPVTGPKLTLELGSWKGIRNGANYEERSWSVNNSSATQYHVTWTNASSSIQELNTLSIRIKLDGAWPTNTRLGLFAPQVNLGAIPETGLSGYIDRGSPYENGSYISLVHAIPEKALVKKNKLDYYRGTGVTNTAATVIITGVNEPVASGSPPESTWVSMEHHDWPGNQPHGGFSPSSNSSTPPIDNLQHDLGNYIQPWCSGAPISITGGQLDPFGGNDASIIQREHTGVSTAGIYAVLDLGEPLQGAYTLSVYVKPSRHTMVQTGVDPYLNVDDERFTSTPMIGLFAYPIDPRKSAVTLTSGEVDYNTASFEYRGGGTSPDRLLSTADMSNIYPNGGKYADIFHYGSGENAIWSGEPGNLTADGYMRLSTTVYIMPAVHFNRKDGNWYSHRNEEFKSYLAHDNQMTRTPEGVSCNKILGNNFWMEESDLSNVEGDQWVPPPTTKMVIGIFMANLHRAADTEFKTYSSSSKKPGYTNFMNEDPLYYNDDYLQPNQEPSVWGRDATSPERPGYNEDVDLGIYAGPGASPSYPYEPIDGTTGVWRIRENWASGDSIMVSHVQLERGVHTNEFSVHGMSNTDQLHRSGSFVSHNDGFDVTIPRSENSTYNPSISHPFYKGPGSSLTSDSAGQLLNKFPPHTADAPITPFVTGEMTIEKATINVDYRAQQPASHILPSYIATNITSAGSETGVILDGMQDVRLANGPRGVCSQGIWIDRGYDFAFIEISPWGIRVHSSADWHVRNNYIPPSSRMETLDNLTINLDYPNIELTRKSDNYTTIVKDAFVSRYNVTQLGAVCPGDTVVSRIYNSELIPFYDKVNPTSSNALTYTGVTHSGWPNYALNQTGTILPTGFKPYIALGCLPITGEFSTKEYLNGDPENTGTYTLGTGVFTDRQSSKAAYPTKMGTHMSEPGSLNSNLSPVDVPGFNDGVFDIYGKTGIAGFVGRVDWDNIRIDYDIVSGSSFIEPTANYPIGIFTGYTQPFYPPFNINDWGSYQIYWKNCLGSGLFTRTGDRVSAVNVYPQIAVPNSTAIDGAHTFDWVTHTELWASVSGNVSDSSTHGASILANDPAYGAGFETDALTTVDISSLDLNDPDIYLQGSSLWPGSATGQQNTSANAIRFMFVASGGVFNNAPAQVPTADSINITVTKNTAGGGGGGGSGGPGYPGSNTSGSYGMGTLGYTAEEYPCDIIPNWKLTTVPKDIYFATDVDAYKLIPPPSSWRDFLYLNNLDNISSAISGAAIYEGYNNTISYVDTEFEGSGLVSVPDSLYGNNAWRNYTEDSSISGIWRSWSYHIVTNNKSGLFQGKLDDGFFPYVSDSDLTGFSGVAKCIFDTKACNSYDDPQNDNSKQYVTVINYHHDENDTYLNSLWADDIPSSYNIGLATTGLTITGNYSNNNRFAVVNGDIEINRGPEVTVTCLVGNETASTYHYVLNGEQFRSLKNFSLAFPITGNYGTTPTPIQISFGTLPRPKKITDLYDSTDPDKWTHWKEKIEQHKFDEFSILSLGGYIADQSHVTLTHSGNFRNWPVGLDESHTLSGTASWTGHPSGYYPYDRTAFVFEGWFRPVGILDDSASGSLFLATGDSGRGLDIYLNNSGNIFANVDLSIDTGAFGQPQSGLANMYVDVGYDVSGLFVETEGDLANSWYAPIPLNSNYASVQWGSWNHIGLILDTKALGDFTNSSNQPDFPGYTGGILQGARSSKLVMTLNGHVVDVKDVGIDPYRTTGSNEDGLFEELPGGYNDTWPKMPRFYYTDGDIGAVLCSGVLSDMDFVRWGYRSNTDTVTDLCTRGAKTMPPMFRPYDSIKVPTPSSGNFSHYEFAHIYPFDEPQAYKGWDRGYGDQPALFYNKKDHGSQLNAYGLSTRETFYETDISPKGRECLRIGPGANIQIPFCSFDERIFNGSGTISQLQAGYLSTANGDEPIYEDQASQQTHREVLEWGTGIADQVVHGHISANSCLRLGGFFKLNHLPPVDTTTPLSGYNILELIASEGFRYHRNESDISSEGGLRALENAEDFAYGQGDHAYLGVDHSGHLVAGTLGASTGVGDFGINASGAFGPFRYTGTTLETGKWYHLGADFSLGSGLYNASPRGTIIMYVSGERVKTNICQLHAHGAADPVTGSPIAYNGFLGLSKLKNASSYNTTPSYPQMLESRFVIGGETPLSRSTENATYAYGDISVSDIVIGYSLPSLNATSEWSWADMAKTGGEYLSGVSDVGFIPPNYIINNIVGSGNSPVSSFYTGVMTYPAISNSGAGTTPLYGTANDGYDYEGVMYGSVVLHEGVPFMNASSYYATFEDDNSEQLLGGEASPIQIANTVPPEGVNLALLNIKEWNTESTVTKLDLSDDNIDNITNVLHGEFYVNNLTGLVKTNPSGDTMSGVITYTPQIDSTEVRVSSYPLFDINSSRQNMGFFMHLLGKGQKRVKVEGSFTHQEAEFDYNRYHYNLSKVKDAIKVTDFNGAPIGFGKFPYSIIVSPYPPTVFAEIASYTGTDPLKDQIKSGLFGWGSGAILTGYANPNDEFTVMLVSERQSIGDTIFVSYPSVDIYDSNNSVIQDQEIYNPIPAMYKVDEDEASMQGLVQHESLDSAWSLARETDSELYKLIIWNASLTGSYI